MPKGICATFPLSRVAYTRFLRNSARQIKQCFTYVLRENNHF